LVQKFSRVKVYIAMALPIPVYGSEILTLRKEDIKKIDIEMKFFRRTGWEPLFVHRRNEEILEELKAEPVDEKLRG
jgi:hypothetical protein